VDACSEAFLGLGIALVGLRLADDRPVRGAYGYGELAEGSLEAEGEVTSPSEVDVKARTVLRMTVGIAERRKEGRKRTKEWVRDR
jgi:hypothetical protein